MEFTYVHTEPCIQMFIVVSVLTAPNWKQSRRPSTAKGSTNCNHTTEHYSAIKKNKQPIRTTWMDLQRTHWLKKVKPEGLHTAWFHLYDILKKQMYRNRTDLFNQWKLISTNCECPRGDIWGSKVLVLPNSSHTANTLRSTTRRTQVTLIQSTQGTVS